MAKDLRPVYTAVNEEQAQAKLAEFHDTWGDRYPAIKGLWDNAWGEFIPFVDYSVEIRRVIYSTNAIESLNSVIRKAIKLKKLFPTDDAVYKLVYLAIQQASKKWSMPVRDWKQALNRFSIEFEDRMPDQL